MSGCVTVGTNDLGRAARCHGGYCRDLDGNRLAVFCST